MNAEQRGLVRRIAAQVDAATNYLPTAQRETRPPRETGEPVRLTPPGLYGRRDRATAHVVTRWLFESTPKLKIRGERVTWTGAGWQP